MRTVGPKTLEAIEAQVFRRSLRVSIWDEDDVEIPIPFDLIPEWPSVEGDLDTMVLRMSLRVVATSQTAGKLLRGRKIQAWEIFAAGEDLSLFKGFIADTKDAIDYSSGRKQESIDLTCAGELSRKLEAHLTRFEWRPTPMNPDAADPYNPVSERIRLTGIVKTYRLDNLVRPTPWASVPVGIPITYPFFPNSSRGDWVNVFDANGVAMTNSTMYTLGVNSFTGVVEVTFLADPGATFSIEIMVLDRWVILDRRKYHDGTSSSLVAPYYQVLHGIAGRAGSERLADPGTTFIRADKPFTPGDFYVDNPAGIFAVGHGFLQAGIPNGDEVRFDGWISVYSGGIEYRGKVESIDKSPTSTTYGRVIVSPSYALRRLSDGAPPTLAGGERVENTTTSHYELLDPGVKQYFKNGTAGAVDFPTLRSAPVGGFYLPHIKNQTVTEVIPNYSATTGPNPGYWLISASQEAIVIEAADRLPQNDVAEFVEQLLLAIGVDTSTLAPGAAASGYALAPVTVTQKKAADLLQEALKASVPPTFRLRELEDGSLTYGHIAQDIAPDLRLRGLRSVTPRELPLQITRCVVLGRQVEVNRAGQFLRGTYGIHESHLVRLFNGVKDGGDGSDGAVCTQSEPTATFLIPACEPGRFPTISKVSVAVKGTIAFRLAGGHMSRAYLGMNPLRVLPTGVVQNDDVAVWRNDYSDLAPCALARDGEAGAWYLQCQFAAWNPSANGTWSAGIDTIDEIEVFHREGAYAEAFFTDQSSQSLSNALYFGGAASVALPAAGYLGSTFTFEAWLSPSDYVGTLQNLFYLDDGGSQNVAIELDVLGKLTLYSSGGNNIRTPDHVGVEVPTHVAVVVNGTTATFYRNGLFWASATLQTPIPAASWSNCSIGRRTFGDRPFVGTLDDIRIWNVARTQAQIRATMFSALTGSEAGLGANWPMNEGTGTIAADVAPGAHHGTINGATWTHLSRRKFWAPADLGASAFGSAWRKPDSTLSMSVRYAPSAWLRRNMAEWHAGLHRTYVVEADGITQAQAREIAESYCDQAARTSEFWEAECSIDPRLQLGDTVEVRLDDDSKANFLVWKYSKGKTTMRVTLANYAR